jgi:hypothetical protein
MAKGRFSISDVISRGDIIRIIIESNKMPGWFAELDLNALNIAKLIDQKYRIENGLMGKGIEDRSGFTKPPRKLKSKNN